VGTNLEGVPRILPGSHPFRFSRFLLPGVRSFQTVNLPFERTEVEFLGVVEAERYNREVRERDLPGGDRTPGAAPE
jgi:hypothetical protein